jgi:hypothetical protein
MRVPEFLGLKLEAPQEPGNQAIKFAGESLISICTLRRSYPKHGAMKKLELTLHDPHQIQQGLCHPLFVRSPLHFTRM